MPEQTLIGVPSLYGGVSRQPPHLRHESQVESATNAGFSPVAGAYKRPGTKFVAYIGNARIKLTGVSGVFNTGDTVTQIGASPVTATVISSQAVSGEATSLYLSLLVTAGTLQLTTTVTGPSGSGALGYLQSQYTDGMELRLHPILRDKREAYLMVLGSAVSGPVAQVPRIFPLAGQEAQVLYESGVEATQKTYLALNTPAARDYRTLSVADTTFLANSTVAMAGNNTTGAIDPTSMPRFIQRTALTPIVQFTISSNVWVARPTGTGTNNPLPRAILQGKKVADMAIHKDRFAIGAGPYILFSAVNNFGLFFVVDVVTAGVVASDTIELQLPGSTITAVDRLVGFREDLVAFGTPQNQFLINEISSATGFAPGNVQCSPNTQYATISIPLVPFKTGIVFAAAQREAGCIYFYRYDDLQITNTADELTLAVQGLLAADITRVSGDTNSGMLFAITEDEPTTVYPFQQTMQGNKVAVNAWFDRWDFDGLERICDIGVLNGVLYILGKLADGNGYVLEGMAIGTTLTAGTGVISPSGGTSSTTGDATEVTPDVV